MFQKKRKAFTLVELLMYMVISTIVISMALTFLFFFYSNLKYSELREDFYSEIILFDEIVHKKHEEKGSDSWNDFLRITQPYDGTSTIITINQKDSDRSIKRHFPFEVKVDKDDDQYLTLIFKRDTNVYENLTATLCYIERLEN